MWSDNLNKVALCFRLLCGLLFSFTCSTRNFNSIFFKNLNILVTPSSLPFFSSLPTSTNFYQLLSILFKYPRDSFFFSSILFLITNFYQLLSIFLHLPLFLFSSTLLIRPHSLYLLTYTSRTHYSMQKSSSRKAQNLKILEKRPPSQQPQVQAVPHSQQIWPADDVRSSTCIAYYYIDVAPLVARKSKTDAYSTARMLVTCYVLFSCSFYDSLGWSGPYWES